MKHFPQLFRTARPSRSRTPLRLSWQANQSPRESHKFSSHGQIAKRTAFDLGGDASAPARRSIPHRTPCPSFPYRLSSTITALIPQKSPQQVKGGWLLIGGGDFQRRNPAAAFHSECLPCPEELLFQSAANQERRYWCDRSKQRRAKRFPASLELVPAMNKLLQESKQPSQPLIVCPQE